MLFVLKLPMNVFTLLIKLAAAYDLVLAVTQSSLDLDNIKEWEVELTGALLDSSVYIALALAFIAYAVVKGDWTVCDCNLILVTFVSLIPAVIHITGYFVLSQFICEWLHAANITICFVGILYLYGNVVWDIRKLRSMNELMAKRSIFGAKDLLFRLVVSLTVVNVVTWIPHIFTAWYAVNTDLVPVYSAGILYWEKAAIATKGACHAAAVAYALYHEPKMNITASTELDGIKCQQQHTELDVAVTAKNGLEFQPSFVLGQSPGIPKHLAYQETVRDG